MVYNVPPQNSHSARMIGLAVNPANPKIEGPSSTRLYPRLTIVKMNSGERWPEVCSGYVRSGYRNITDYVLANCQAYPDDLLWQNLSAALEEHKLEDSGRRAG